MKLLMKKITVYQVASDFDIRLISQDNFSKLAYHPCSEADLSKVGFLPFLEGNLDSNGEVEDTFVKSNERFIYFQVKEQKKVVPNREKLKPLVDKALRKYVTDEPTISVVEDIEKETRQAIEDKVFQDQLKNCFHSETTTLCILDKEDMLLYIEAGSYKAAEVITGCIRSATNTLPVIKLSEAVKCSNIGDHLMTMIQKQHSKVITLGNYCKLVDDNKGVHTVSNKELYDAEDELSIIFKKRYTCSEVKLEHDGVYDYKIKNTLEFSSVRLNTFDKEASEDGNLLLTANAVQELVSEIVKELGGL